MSQFYDRMAATALRLIERFGQPVTLRDEVPGEYDFETSTMTEPTVVDQLGSGILQDYSLSERAGISNQAGSLIQQGDKKIILAAHGITMPSLTTKVIAGGETWVVVNVKEINPAGTQLIYELQGRR